MGKKGLLGNIKLIPTDEKLTQASGLGPMIEAFDHSYISRHFYKKLPRRSSSRSLGEKRLGLIFLSSFLYGHDCIDDLDEFDGDEYLENFYQGNLPAPRTMGDFLKDFKEEQISGLNEYLSYMSSKIYKQLQNQLAKEYKPGALHLSIDSTPHVQHGLKMEGLAYNYDGKWGLESQRISDQVGLTYGFQLRPGNIGKAVGAKDLILQAFKHISFREEKYLSGDSAYLTQEVIKAAMSVGTFFTITAPDTIKWKDKLKDLDWQAWDYSEEEKERAKKKNQELAIVEVARYHWRPSWDKNNQLHFPVVIKREWVSFKDQVKKNATGNLFEYTHQDGQGDWKYYAVVTNMNLAKYSYEDVIRRHNKRGNCERFIKEEKYGFDLLHFPCLKLQSNYAFGLLAQVAHNILRWLAVMERPHKPHFSKKLRRRFIYIPGKLIKHARQLYLKIPRRFYKEVQTIKEALQLKPESALCDESIVATSSG